MASGVLTVGLSGLNAAQIGVLTTSHNISNASTPGYSRQYIVQTTNEPVFSGSGFIGQGTSVQTVRRAYSQYLNGQVLTAQSGAAEMESYLSQIEQLDNLFADPTAGLTPALSTFFTGVQAVAANPASIPARQTMLSGAQSLVARFQSIDQRICEIRDGVNEQIQTSVTSINAFAQQLADINQRIINAQAGGESQQANDLQDQRDQMVADMNKEIRVQTVLQGDGSYSAFIGNGQPVVIGAVAYQLAPAQGTDDPEKITVQITTPFGSRVDLLDSMLTGGNLGGLIAFRNTSLDPAQNALGRIAIALGNSVNDLHRLGVDLNGNAGGDFFSLGAPNVLANGLNTDNGTMVTARIVDSDYMVEFLGDDGPYQITGISSGSTALGFADETTFIDGVPISISSGGRAGDRFVVRPGNSADSRAVASSDNTGTATVKSGCSNVQALTASDYRLDYVSANTFRLTRLSDSSTWTGTGASPQEALNDLATEYQAGFLMTVGGVPPTVGDSFLVRPTRLGASGLSVKINDPASIAAAAPFRTSAILGNNGGASISNGRIEHTQYVPLPGNALTLDPTTHRYVVWDGANPPVPVQPKAVALTFDATAKQFTVIGAVPAVNPIAYDPGASGRIDVSFNGLSFTISGTPADGDQFVIAANASGVADNRIAQQLGSLQTASALAARAYDGSSSANALAFDSSATASFAEGYAQTVSEIGNKARQVEITGKAQQTLAEQALAKRESMAGVNLDEEAGNLLRYQQAYQAAARMIDMAGKLFDEVLALGR